MSRFSSALCCLGLAAASLSAQSTRSAPRAFTPADWYRLTTLSTPSLSPDGKLIAFTVTTVREAENKRHAEVWVVAADGGEPTRFTSPGTESSRPRFSPDGKYLFFTSNRPGGKPGPWALRMDQPSGEAFQIEHYPVGSMPRDRRFAVFTDTVTPPVDSAAAPKSDKADPWEKTPLARPPFGAITRPLDPKRFDGRQFVDLPIKSNDAGYLPNRAERRVWHPTQIFAQAFDSTVRHQVTSTAYSHDEVAVSPDGKWIAFAADPELRPDSVVVAERDSLARLPYNAARDERERNESDLFIIPGEGGTPRRLTRAMGDEFNFDWSPDGRTIGFQARPGRAKSVRLYTVDVASGAIDNLLGDWRYEPDGWGWLENGDIFMSAQIGGRSAFHRVSPRAKTISEVIGGRRRIAGLSYDARHARVAYVATGLTTPTELYVADADGKNERKLTSFNDRLNAEIAWADAERFTFRSVGGLEIESWLMKPYGYVPGRKYPLVLYVHGGPHSAYGENWFDEFQNLAAAGMWVLFTNPRGSTGYGADFTFSTRGRWGAEDYQDLMKAVDIVARRPDVDSTRMGVTGGSYGGFMTDWITTRTHRFKAAESDRMVGDWVAWYGSSDAQGLTEFEFYGKPWDNHAMYDSLAPITHVGNVTTPTLIVHSEDDFRAPMVSAEEWFIALRKRGIPAEFVRYPRSTHELSRSGEPWLLVDRLGRLRQWFTHWLIEGAGPGVAAGTAVR
jgi:dipeptidyl aminopeptidase/acylaminoacyl peptidase